MIGPGGLAAEAPGGQFEGEARGRGPGPEEETAGGLLYLLPGAPQEPAMETPAGPGRTRSSAVPSGGPAGLLLWKAEFQVYLCGPPQVPGLSKASEKGLQDLVKTEKPGRVLDLYLPPPPSVPYTPR